VGGGRKGSSESRRKVTMSHIVKDPMVKKKAHIHLPDGEGKGSGKPIREGISIFCSSHPRSREKRKGTPERRKEIVTLL